MIGIDTITEVIGDVSEIALRDDQRLVIETAHGLMQIKARLDRSRGKSVRLELVTPVFLRWRKGPADSTPMYLQYLSLRDGTVRPAFSLLLPHVLGEDRFYLAEPKSLLIGQTG